MNARERALGVGALLMALCCGALPLLAGAVGGGLIANAGLLGVAPGVLLVAAAAILVVRRRSARW